MPATADSAYLRTTPAEPLPPPALRRGALGWLRENLFSSVGNCVLTLVCIALVAWVVPPLLRFFVFDAVWSGSDREACLASPQLPEPGACWAFCARATRSAVWVGTSSSYWPRASPSPVVPK